MCNAAELDLKTAAAVRDRTHTRRRSVFVAGRGGWIARDGTQAVLNEVRSQPPNRERAQFLGMPQ
jgi:hypothetical protein